jgi:hypothetical protein
MLTFEEWFQGLQLAAIFIGVPFVAFFIYVVWGVLGQDGDPYGKDD